MMHKSKTLGAIALLFVAAHASAKTDVSAKISQLKENSSASQNNLLQYEDNLKIVNANISETEKALAVIQKEKTNLTKQTASTGQGKKGIDTAKAQLDVYMKEEQTKLSVELTQIEELKKTLAQLEANTKKREENIARYQEKNKKVDSELANWSERNQSIGELDQALQTKEAEAKADLAKLKEKKANYEEEISKWRKQVRVSDRMVRNFSNLKD